MTARSADPDRPEPAGRSRVDWDAVEEQAEAAERARHGQRRWWVIGVVAVVAMSLVAVVWGLSATRGRVHWVDTGFQVVSDARVDVRFDLRRDPQRAVVCRLEAQAASHVVVGRTEAEIGPAQSSPSRHVAGVSTASPAITGYVDECWYADEAPRQ
ncbi:DUF4307 domain-containing protein [Serinicoccus kebangsaanensis]|uniref:DUF4307 domain-containing protein n=1 Tax=Serinicoccus kebangsaanensis TaxID=2602069 RepID=UPI00124E170C|nr:DUF4307 domain-containing protein [Serinicoccus kebangsaanensis]